MTERGLSRTWSPSGLPPMSQLTETKGRKMRTFTVQIDGGLDGHAEEMLAAFITAMPVGDQGAKFKGHLHTGVVVNHRRQGVWTVSFRPSPAGQNARQYGNPRAAARAVIEHNHNAEAIN